MKKLVLVLSVAFFLSCTSNGYKVVLVYKDGTEKVKNIDAENDTVAYEKTFALCMPEMANLSTAHIINAEGDTVDVKGIVAKKFFGN